MSTIIVYTCQDRQGNEDSTFEEQDYNKAKEYARKYHQRLIENEYEWTESMPVDGDDYTIAPAVTAHYDHALGDLVLCREGDDWVFRVTAAHLRDTNNNFQGDHDTLCDYDASPFQIVPTIGNSEYTALAALEKEGVTTNTVGTGSVNLSDYETVAECDGTGVTALYELDGCDLPEQVLRYIDVHEICARCKRPHEEMGDLCAACDEPLAVATTRFN